MACFLYYGNEDSNSVKGDKLFLESSGYEGKRMIYLVCLLTLEKAVTDSQIETKGIISNKSTQILAYAYCTAVV